MSSPESDVPESVEPMLFPISERAASLARIHIGVTSTLLALALALFGLRIWVRTRPVWRVGKEDYIMSICVVSSVALSMEHSMETNRPGC